MSGSSQTQGNLTLILAIAKIKHGNPEPSPDSSLNRLVELIWEGAEARRELP